jgi:TDG/mug DNA glycosylase family protein
MHDSPERRAGLPPVVGDRPQVLILGSFPSAQSLSRQQYYGNPKNQFWAVMGAVAGIDPGLSYPERLSALTLRGIALFDVVASCVREGSADAKIRDPRPADLPALLAREPTIRHIALNGRTGAEHWLVRLLPEVRRMPGISVATYPSTSPANARLTLREKIRIWAGIRPYLRQPRLPE